MNSRTRLFAAATGLVASLLASVAPIPAAHAATVPGATRGEFTVSPAGAAQYGIDMLLPPGIGGLQPQLSFQHSSQADNGLLGVGWSIGGLMAVNRCPQTTAQDGARTGVTITSTDRFCLNGKKLVLVSGTYGANNAEYRTEIDEFSRIVSYTSVVARGPDYFKVWTRDGRVIELGNTTDSKLVANRTTTTANSTAPYGYVNTVALATNQEVLQWNLNKVSDRSENYYTVTYTKTDLAGESYPDQITYSGNAAAGYTAVTPPNTVKFVYEARPTLEDALTAADYPLQFIAGSKVLPAKRIKEVQISADGVLARKYKLAYKPAATWGAMRSRLDTVTECTYTSGGAESCYAPTTFDTITFDGCIYDSVSSQLGTAGQVVGTIPLAQDFNGDGRTDIVAVGISTTGMKVMSSISANAVPSGTDFVDTRTCATAAKQGQAFGALNTSTVTTANLGAQTNWSVLTGDVTGDGVPEIVAVPTGNSLQLNPWVAIRQTSGAFTAAATSASDTSNYSTTTGQAYGGDAAWLADVNADGKLDLVAIKWVSKTSSVTNVAIFFRQGNGNGTFAQTVRQDRTIGLNDMVAPLGFNNFVGDVDGDGRADLAFVRLRSGVIYADVLAGNGVGAAVFQAVVSSPLISQAKFDNAFAAGTVTRVNLLDINRDGMSDLVFFKVLKGTGVLDPNYNKGAVLSALANGGAKFMATDASLAYVMSGMMINTTSDLSSTTYPWRNSYTDFNGDGRPDLIVSLVLTDASTSKDRLLVYFFLNRGDGRYIFGGAGWSTTPTAPSLPAESLWTRLAGDFDGDGLGDLASVQANTTNGFQVYPIFPRPSLPDLLTKITDGNGSVTEIAQAPLTRDEIYTKGTATWPNVAVQAPLYVVRSVKRDTGNSTTPVATTYKYSGGKVDLNGRGFLGFVGTEVTDPLGIITTTTYSQSFPYIGMASVIATARDAVTLSRTTNILDVKTITHASGRSSHFPYVLNSTTTQYEYTSAGLTAQAVVANTYDTWGNLLTASTTTTGDGNTHTRLVTNTYYANTINATTWRIGELNTQTDRRTGPLPGGGTSDITRTEAYSYDALGRVAGKVLEPTNNSLKISVALQRDRFGNLITQTTSGTDILTRIETTAYDASGRFPVSKTNAEGHVIGPIVTDARFGLPTSVRDPNGTYTTRTYDTFGRVTRELLRGTDETGMVSDGPYTDVAYLACDATCNSVQGETFRVRTARVGFEPKTVYVDRNGRDRRAVTKGMDGRDIVVETEYDNMGRVQRESTPRFQGDTTYWTSRTYDVVGRIATETQPTNRTLTYAYSGRTTAVTNAKSQTTARTADALGRLATMTDAASGQQTYAYDAFGNLVRTTDAAGNVIVNQYDIRGNRTQMQDPDLGTRNYDYDVAGQLIWQQDAKGQVTTYSYDRLGRLLKRVEPDLTSNNAWDTAFRGLGRLARQTASNGYERSYRYDTLGRLQTVRTGAAIDPEAQPGDPDLYYSTRYDSAGRPESVQYPTGFGYRNVYDARGYLIEVRNAWTDALYWQANARDAAGRVTRETYGNGLSTQTAYKPDTGYVDTVQTGPVDGLGVITASVQNDTYNFDALGNLTLRSQYFDSVSLTELYDYDVRNRLTTVTNGADVRVYGYDAIGNIINKPEAGTYSYAGCGGAHRVCSITGTLNTSFTYDANGNMLTGNGRTNTWTAANLPATVADANGTETIIYSPDGERLRRTSVENGQTTTTVYLSPRIDLGGTFEKIRKPDGSVQYVHFVYASGNVIGSVTTTSTAAWDSNLAVAPDDNNPNAAGLTESVDPSNLVYWDATGDGREALNARTLGAASTASLTGQRSYDKTQVVRMRGEFTTTAGTGGGSRYVEVLMREDTGVNPVSFGIIIDGSTLKMQSLNSPLGNRTVVLNMQVQPNTTYVVELDTASNIGLVRVYKKGDAGQTLAWSAPQIIESNTGSALYPQIATDGNGNVIVVWQEKIAGGTRWDLWSNRYTAGIGWGVPQLLETDNVNSVSRPVVAMDRQGNAIVAWAQLGIWARRYDVASGWQAAQQLIAPPYSNIHDPKVAMDPSGNAVVICSVAHSGTVQNIWASRYMSGAGWTAAQLIETSDVSHAINPRVTLDPMGNALAVWQQSDGTRNNIWANRYVPGAGWGVAQLIETNNAGGASLPDVEVDPAGNGMAVWHHSDGTRTNIWSNRYEANVGWGTAQLIETDNAGAAVSADVDVDAAGNATAVWQQSDGTTQYIWVNRYASGTGWSTPLMLSAGISPRVDVDAGGSAIVSWTKSNGSYDDVWIARYLRDAGWQTAAVVEQNSGDSAGSPAIAALDTGVALAVWHELVSGSGNIGFARYDLQPAGLVQGSIAHTWDPFNTNRKRTLALETRATVTAGSFSNETYADNLSEMAINQEVRYFHRDHQGSVAVITSATGAVIERFSYDAWGKRRQLDGTDDTTSTIRGVSTSRGYTLHEHLDAMGLIHMNGRAYDPLVGRFLSADPNVFHATNTQGFNRYSYVYNNPMSAVDPSGYMRELSDTALGGISAVNNYWLQDWAMTQAIQQMNQTYASGNGIGTSNFNNSVVVTTNNNAGPQNQSGTANVPVGGSGSSSTASGTRPTATTTVPAAPLPTYNTGGGTSSPLPGVWPGATGHLPTKSQTSGDAPGCASAATCALYDGLSSTEFSTGAELAGLSAGIRSANDIAMGSALHDGVRRAEELYGKLPDSYQKTAQSISATGQRLDVLSKGLGAAGYVFSAYQYGENMAKGNYGAAALNATDALMGAVAFVPGLGTATSILYFSGRFAYDRLSGD
ncbi:MAG: RHS repeat-associated core domain-containing protein [Pseudomonadota bacterium]